MEPASQAQARDLPSNVRESYATRARLENVPRTTLWYQDHGRPSLEPQAPSQQYLTPSEEKALVQYLLRMAAVGSPARVKYLPSLTLSIARRRSTIIGSTDAIKPLSKDWPQAIAKRHPQLKQRRNRPMNWDRHDNNTYDKVTELFEVIKDELCKPEFLPENCYNMDETGIMLSMLGVIKVFVGKDDRRDCRGAGERRTMVTAIECKW